MTVLVYAIAAFACAGAVALFAYIEHRLHLADRAGGRVIDVLLVLAAIGAVAFTLALIQSVLSW